MDDSAYHLEMFIYIPLKQPCVSDGWRHSAYDQWGSEQPDEDGRCISYLFC